MLGFVPLPNLLAIRKSLIQHNEENLTFYFIMALRNFISILELENYSVTTTLFPTVTGNMCLFFILLVLLLRYRPDLQ